MTIALFTHVLSDVIWIGGMFRLCRSAPAAMEALEPPQRLRLWTGIFRRFFPCVGRRDDHSRQRVRDDGRWRACRST